KVRELTFSRDEESPWEQSGTPQDWEVDFHFALPLDEFAENLADAEWEETEISRAKRAYSDRDSSALPRLPDASYQQLSKFAEKHGFDFENGAHAHYKKPGLLRRLFGR